MMINPVSQSGLTVPAGTDAVRAPSEAGGASFSNVLGQVLDGAAQSHHNAEAAVRDMAMWVNRIICTKSLQMGAQADLSFHLILEIRNRLSEAYQENHEDECLMGRMGF